MIKLVNQCFPGRIESWSGRLKELVPGYGIKLNDNPTLADEIISTTRLFWAFITKLKQTQRRAFLPAFFKPLK